MRTVQSRPISKDLWLFVALRLQQLTFSAQTRFLTSDANQWTEVSQREDGSCPLALYSALCNVSVKQIGVDSVRANSQSDFARDVGKIQTTAENNHRGKSSVYFITSRFVLVYKLIQT